MLPSYGGWGHNKNNNLFFFLSLIPNFSELRVGQEITEPLFILLLVIANASTPMSRCNSVIAGRQIDGVWHTAIVAYGEEFFYGGIGIQSCNPVGVISRLALTLNWNIGDNIHCVQWRRSCCDH